jgi:hypothetical protein
MKTRKLQGIKNLIRRKGLSYFSFILVLIVTALISLQQPLSADVVLKTMVVNPSQTKKQTTTLQAYLPYEAKPQDIIDIGDLEVDYDIEKGLYYVYKVVELEPGESVVREIRLKDIWLISQRELESFSARAQELLDSLKNTAYFEKAVILSQDVEEKQGEIISLQTSVANAAPQVRIGAYRTNKNKLESIKAHIDNLEKMFLEHKIAQTGSAGKVPVERSWAVILGVIVLLGILSSVFFIIWNKQAKALQEQKQASLQDQEEEPE